MKMLDRMEEMRWTQAQVAEKLGCSQQYVSRIVKGNENLTLEMLSKIEDNLGVEVFKGKGGMGQLGPRMISTDAQKRGRP